MPAERAEGGDEWKMLGNVFAASALEAQKTAAKEQDGDGLSFVAVPARSWKPMQRTVETIQKESWTA